MLLQVLGSLLLPLFALGAEVCYPRYGCFNDDQPFDISWATLPKSPSFINTKFRLFTRQQQASPHFLSDQDASTIRSSSFNASKKTTFISHGYLESGTVFYMKTMVDELLRKDDMNVVVIDWKRGARPYQWAFGNVRLVGMQVTKLVELMNSDFGLKFSNVHLMGFSIGAQLVGHAGKFLKRNNHTVGRISGLDPAAPYYEHRPPVVRLDATDADFVDALHTDTRTLVVKGFGIQQRSGHIDTYPNGGFEQPGCRTLDNGVVDFFTCNHYRATRYYTESINSQCPFEAYPCRSYADFKKGLCTSCPQGGCPKLGYQAENVNNRFDGSYFLFTKERTPFCVYHYKVTLYTGSGLFTSLITGKVKLIIKGDKQTSEEIVLPRRYLRSGSIETFVAITRHDLGNLLRVKVMHSARVEKWYLKKIVILKFGQEKSYVACFNRWLNQQNNDVNLVDEDNIIAGC